MAEVLAGVGDRSAKHSGLPSQLFVSRFHFVDPAFGDAAGLANHLWRPSSGQFDGRLLALGDDQLLSDCQCDRCVDGGRR